MFPQKGPFLIPVVAVSWCLPLAGALVLHEGYAAGSSAPHIHKPDPALREADDFTEALVALTGSFLQQDIAALQQALLTSAGGDRQPVALVTVTSGMIDLVENLLCSLDAVGVGHRAIAVGLERGLCTQISEGRSCVEVVPRGAQWVNQSESGFEYATDDFKSAVQAKLGVATLAVLSNLTEGILFTDADVAFLGDPFKAAQSRVGATSADAVFQVNNALAASAKSCSDVAKKYRKKDGTWRVDVNSGMYYVRHTPQAQRMMVSAYELLYNRKAGGDKMDQGALNTAIQQLKGEIMVTTFDCDEFANGNVFFAHRESVGFANTVAVHANWMVGKALKMRCMHAAGIWMLQADGSRFLPHQRVGRPARRCVGASDLGRKSIVQLHDSGRVNECRDTGSVAVDALQLVGQMLKALFQS